MKAIRRGAARYAGDDGALDEALKIDGEVVGGSAKPADCLAQRSRTGAVDIDGLESEWIAGEQFAPLGMDGPLDGRLRPSAPQQRDGRQGVENIPHRAEPDDEDARMGHSNGAKRAQVSRSMTCCRNPARSMASSSSNLSRPSGKGNHRRKGRLPRRRDPPPRRLAMRPAGSHPADRAPARSAGRVGRQGLQPFHMQFKKRIEVARDKRFQGGRVPRRQFTYFDSGVHLTASCIRSRAAWETASSRTRVMQRWSMGHSRNRQGAHSTG